MEKPVYKRTKFWVTVSATVLMALALIFGEKFTPQHQELAKQIMLLAIVYITGHTVTDVASQLKKKGE